MVTPLHATFTVAYVLGVTPGKWAGIWRERMPRHPLVLTQTSPADAVTNLVGGDADVALLRLPIEHPLLSTIPLYVEKPVVVAPKGHAIEALDEVALTELDDLLAGEWPDTVELVAANVGVAIMPQSVARALSRKGVIARPVSGAPETRVALVWRETTPEVEEFIGIVRGRTPNSSRGEPTPKTPPTPKTSKSPRTSATAKSRRTARGPKGAQKKR
ncbi:MAG: LysR family transcriptional regulator [Salinibacterium sp.]|nr:LysR family transcriptional regulator [Salinibacterium sp.]